MENLQDTIAEGLSQLGRSADGTMQVFLTLTLNVRGKMNKYIAEFNYPFIVKIDYNVVLSQQNLGLHDVSFLKCYKHLQTIILSQNQLSGSFVSFVLAFDVVQFVSLS